MDGADDLLSMLFEGQQQWLDLAAHLEDPRFVARDRRRCAAHMMDARGVCNIKLSTAIDPIEPIDEHLGRVVDAHADLVQIEGEPNADGCQKYADCLAAIRVGQDVPVPENQRRVFAVFQLIHAEPLQPSMRDPHKVREVIALYRAALARHQEPTRSAEEELKVRKMAASAEYLEEHAQRIAGPHANPKGAP